MGVRFLLPAILMNIFLLTVQITSQNKYPTIEEKTKGMEKHSGFFTFYWDSKEGAIWLEIDKLDEEFLYVNSLPRGVGSNDIGLDRGQLGGERIVKFERHGPKIFLVQPNYYYRAISDNVSERKAVEYHLQNRSCMAFKLKQRKEAKFWFTQVPFF